MERYTPKESQLRLGESAGTLDLLSAVYRVRAMPLATGSSYLMSVRSGDQDYQAQIKVSGRQMIKTNVGSFNAIATRVNVKKGEDYDIRAYFSDDEWHVPVLITARYHGSDIQVELAASALTAPARTSQTRGDIRPGLPPPVATPTPSGTRAVRRSRSTPRRYGRSACGCRCPTTGAASRANSDREGSG